METSDSYIVMEKMIRLGEIFGSELGRLLGVLEEQGQITAQEHKALLELAEEINIDSMSAP